MAQQVFYRCADERVREEKKEGEGGLDLGKGGEEAGGDVGGGGVGAIGTNQRHSEGELVRCLW